MIINGLLGIQSALVLPIRRVLNLDFEGLGFH
jgi:hypothetical protein